MTRVIIRLKLPDIQRFHCACVIDKQVVNVLFALIIIRDVFLDIQVHLPEHGGLDAEPCIGRHEKTLNRKILFAQLLVLCHLPIGNPGRPVKFIIKPHGLAVPCLVINDGLHMLHPVLIQITAFKPGSCMGGITCNPFFSH